MAHFLSESQTQGIGLAHDTFVEIQFPVRQSKELFDGHGDGFEMGLIEGGVGGI
jgi:hypothetical protein